MFRYATFGLTAVGLLAMPASAQWVSFSQDPSRLVAPTNVGANDQDEKDYAVGDIDQDGDDDLVVVRKQPFTSTGKRVNLLLMNENGVLTDRTADYASASDVPGDNGFLTATNDRDVALADINGDGWLDMITAPTLTDNQAKNLSHPRIYINMGEVDGVWQGFEYQDARIPQMHPNAGPRFCSVRAGDINNDGHADLYFGDYDSGGSQIFDFNNKLLINDGNGFFTDETNSRMDSQMRATAFGASSHFGDFNGDGAIDIAKQTSLNNPTHIAIIYNDPTDHGFFDFYDTIYDLAPYFVVGDDLNNDGLLDMIIVDDGTDRYMINTGNNGAGRANFSQQNFDSSGGFGGDAKAVDLNNDGLNDVIITDVDVDIPGCSRTTLIYRNLGGGNMSSANFEQPIPINQLQGVHDVALIDLNEDGWMDIIMGKCNGTQIWMNQPPIGMQFNYPGGLPTSITPDEEVSFNISLNPIGGTVDPSSATLHLSVADGPFTEVPLTDLGDNLFEGSLPATACTETVSFYISAGLNEGGSFTDPSSAPGTTYTALSALGVTTVTREEFELPANDWTVLNDASLTSGGWEQVEPIGSVGTGGDLAAPDMDATQGAKNTMCFVTQNGTVGQINNASFADVDGGPTQLISPVYDLDGTDGTFTFARWMVSYSGVVDALTVAISNDNGDTWNDIPALATSGTSGWETVSFTVSDYIDPTAEIRLRFTASDSPNNSVTEAGIDNVQLDTVDCGDVKTPCPADLDGDGEVGVTDLVEVILDWDCTGDDCVGDINNSGRTDVGDLVDMVLVWGDCE